MSIDLLIVDDSAVMRAMIRKVLSMTDLPIGSIHEAENGAEGLELLAQEHVDVALVDMNMPVMGGAEMIEAIHSDPGLAKLPIVVISTESSETRIAELEQKGVQFIHKPFSPEIIRDILTELTGSGDE